MMNNKLFFKNLFGEKTANILNEALILVGGEDVELEYVGRMPDKPISFIMEFSSSASVDPIILIYDKDRFGKEIVLTSETSKFCYATRFKKTYIDFACETEEKGIFHLEITFDDNGYIEYFNEKTCSFWNFTYMDDLMKAKEEGFRPDNERHFKLHNGSLRNKEIISCIKECGNIIKKLEKSNQRRR